MNYYQNISCRSGRDYNPLVIGYIQKKGPHTMNSESRAMALWLLHIVVMVSVIESAIKMVKPKLFSCMNEVCGSILNMGPLLSCSI